VRVRQLEESDRTWAEELVREHFGSSRVVSRGVLHHSRDLSGLVAEDGTSPVGLLQYRTEHDEAEVVILISDRKRAGVGRTLMRAFRGLGETAGLRRIRVITTNNNRAAQAFYEALGMCRCAVYPDAVVEARRLKPELPELDTEGVPIRDEIEYEWRLEGR